MFIYANVVGNDASMRLPVLRQIHSGFSSLLDDLDSIGLANNFHCL
jgi:hypothetical protein